MQAAHKFLWPKFSFITFLLALLAMLVLTPVLQELEPVNDVVYAFITLFLVISVYMLSHRREQFIISLILFVPTLLLNWAAVFQVSVLVQNLSLIANITFFGYISCIILASLFRAREVNLNIIFAAISLYFLIGLEWGYLFAILELNHAGSLMTSVLALESDLSLHDIDSNLLNYIYFSLVTLTTVGYGDIIPVSPLARSLASIEAVMGQMYLTVLVARLVGVYISEKWT
jgi:hypothetical protein